jgi:hypothetical protein
MPHAPSILATIVLELVLAASGGLLTRMLCLRSLVKDLAVGSAIGPSTLGFILWRRSYRARQTAVDRCRRRPLASSIGALANRADVEGPGFRLAMLTRDRTSPDHRAPDRSAEIAHWSDCQPIRWRPSADLSFRWGQGIESNG